MIFHLPTFKLFSALLNLPKAFTYPINCCPSNSTHWTFCPSHIHVPLSYLWRLAVPLLLGEMPRPCTPTELSRLQLQKMHRSTEITSLSCELTPQTRQDTAYSSKSRCSIYSPPHYAHHTQPHTLIVQSCIILLQFFSFNVSASVIRNLYPLANLIFLLRVGV